MDQLVSVIIPAYNAEKIVSEAVESVLRQTYPNFEVIVIDDCSKDGTYSVLEELSQKDSRVRIFKNEKNSGVSETRNRGVSLAKGEYIAFLDSDDVWNENKLECQLELMTAHPECPLSYTGVSHMNSEGQMYGYVLPVPDSVNYKTLLKQNIIICSSVMAKKEVIEKYPFRHDEMHEDFAVWLQILRDIGDARGVAAPLICYRVASGTKSSNKLKSAVMTWRVYRYVGLGLFARLYYMPSYIITGIRKYKGISDSK